ncbi:MAG: site-specific integrase [Ruminiclostridium sp.]|nr:site-specific integrase [Ruminiclostridium sp.]
MLYWCGIRLGELLALTKSDFDFEASTVSITKSYQKLDGRDVITDPKTPKSKRVITMPDFLSEEMQEYINSLYGLKKDDRLFLFTKSYLHHEIDRGSKEKGIKRIRVHDILHSHVSLLIELGFTPVAIAERMGHESIDMTLYYAHMFPAKQKEMAEKLALERNDKNVEEGKGREKPLAEQGGSIQNVPRGE